MGKILALYHAGSETIGLIGEVLKMRNRSIREFHLYRGEAVPALQEDTEALVVMGGPMNVDETHLHPFLAPEIKLIEAAIRKEIPVLGICLGSQLIAKALGSRVYPNKFREVGWHPIEWTEAAQSDPVLGNSPNPLTVLHWHGDTFDLPQGAVHLARTGKCENQAFRWGKNVYAFQFHLEVTPEMAREWARVDEAYVKGAGEDPAVLLHRTPEAFQALEPHAFHIFDRFFAE